MDIEEVGRKGAQHDEFAMREIDDAGDTELKRKARRDRGVKPRNRDREEKRLGDVGKIHALSFANGGP